LGTEGVVVKDMDAGEIGALMLKVKTKDHQEIVVETDDKNVELI